MLFFYSNDFALVRVNLCFGVQSFLFAYYPTYLFPNLLLLSMIWISADLCITLSCRVTELCINLPITPLHCWLGHLTRKNRPQYDL